MSEFFKKLSELNYFYTNAYDIILKWDFDRKVVLFEFFHFLEKKKKELPCLWCWRFLVALKRRNIIRYIIAEEDENYLLKKL